VTTHKKRSDATLCAGESEHFDRGSVNSPIYQTATFRFDTTEQVADYAEGHSERFLYTRYGNPTVQAAERRIAELERAPIAAIFSSGQAATSAWCYAHLRPGDRFVISNRLYGGTVGFFMNYLQPFGVQIEQVDFQDLNAVGEALRGAKACWFETPTNPTAQIVDGPAIADLSKKHGVISVIDNTFATPLLQKPLTWGIDWVMHSVTKYLNGHSDLIGGALVPRAGSDPSGVLEIRKSTGGVMDPHAAFLLSRGMRTLALRVERHNANALALARHCHEHPKIAHTYYPGLESDPGHAIAARQMNGGFGGIVAVDVQGGFDAAARFVDHLEVLVNAASLGGTESLVSMPVLTSHVHASDAERALCRVTDATVRISVGLEDIADLIDDVDNALKAV